MLRIINESTYCGYGIIQCRLFCHSGRRTTSGHGHWPGAGWGWCLLSHSISAELPSCCSVAAALFCCSAATTLTAAAGQARAMVTGPGGGAAPGVGQMVNLDIV